MASWLAEEDMQKSERKILTSLCNFSYCIIVLLCCYNYLPYQNTGQK